MKIPNIFRTLLSKYCKGTKITVKRIKIVHCDHNNKSDWAQNDAMMKAYIDGMDYGYRISDGTRFETLGWTEIFVQTLKSLHPPNIGVVGLTHSGGNTDILIYGFTSSHHSNLFGFHHTKLFVDWFAGYQIEIILYHFSENMFLMYYKIIKI